MRKLITVALLTAALASAIGLYFLSVSKERKNEMLVKDAPNVEEAANDIAPPWKRVEEALVDTVVIEQKEPHESAVLLEISGLRETCTSSAHLAPLTLNSKRHFSAHCCSSLAR